MENQVKLNNIKNQIKKLYDEYNENLPYHGWHHINFVRKKAVEFSTFIGANTFLVEVASLVHDLNYIIKNDSIPEIASDMRKRLLSESGFDDDEIEKIEEIIIDSHLEYRSKSNCEISDECKALSDADMLFKSLPITPVLFSMDYLTETKSNIFKLADKVLSEQKRLIEQDIYFYTELAKSKYMHWAKTNVNLWKNIKESSSDPDVISLINVKFCIKELTTN